MEDAALDHAGDVFATAAEQRGTDGPSIKDLQAKIGQLAMEKDFLAGALGRIDVSTMRAQSDDRSRARASITRQAQRLELSRASAYYLPKATPAADLAPTWCLDELHLKPSV